MRDKTISDLHPVRWEEDKREKEKNERQKSEKSLAGVRRARFHAGGRVVKLRDRSTRPSSRRKSLEEKPTEAVTGLLDGAVTRRRLRITVGRGFRWPAKSIDEDDAPQALFLFLSVI
ncbi:unnamed protein product [Cuscuta epithymum]|uniref:Uncharacterized protein n=1 Tax=Cuscuta epithymum TaxID=186058 RepID=A0AAV0GHN0_9ASTE|nr:unnamed protein product [Cuscuta epithymum]CAH9147457.1 unnamed protein product [Cuscuta epithymum]